LRAEMMVRNLTDFGLTPRSRMYLTTVMRLPPVAFMGSVKMRSLPSSSSGLKYDLSRSSRYSMLDSFLVSSRRILNRAKGVT